MWSSRLSARSCSACRRRADRIEAHLAAGLMGATEREVVKRWLS